MKRAKSLSKPTEWNIQNEPHVIGDIAIKSSVILL